MQKLTAEVIKQLNNLGGGFPPAPTGPNNEPQNAEQWILGDWLEEIRVRPGVPAAVDLPLLDNEAGDVRFVVSLGTWYWWDGLVWAPAGGGGGGVATVTASAPLSSSGGANPDISFPSWPANAPGALTNDGAGALSWVPAGSGTVVDVPSVATELLAAGEAVRFVSGGVEKADATDADARLQPVGFAVTAAGIGAPVDVRVTGLATVPAALFDVAPAGSDVGKRVWLSTTAGRVTLTAPSAVGAVVQRVGILATLAGGGGSPQILVQVGDPVLL